MRREIAFVVAEVVSIFPGALISVFGDGRAQYGYALLLTGLPVYCLATTLLMLPVFCVVERQRSATWFSYLAAMTILASCTFVLVLWLEAGIVSALALAVSIGTAFLLSALLSDGVNLSKIYR